MPKPLCHVISEVHLLDNFARHQFHATRANHPQSQQSNQSSQHVAPISPWFGRLAHSHERRLPNPRPETANSSSTASPRSCIRHSLFPLPKLCNVGGIRALQSKQSRIGAFQPILKTHFSNCGMWGNEGQRGEADGDRKRV